MPFSLSTLKLIGGALAALLVISLVAGGYAYVTHLDNARVAAEQKAAAFAVKNAVQDETIKQQEAHARQVAAQVAADQQALVGLAAAQNEHRVAVDRLTTELQKHNLRTLANAKPGLVQGRINHGTAAAFDSLRRASATGDGKGGRVGEPATIPSAAPGSAGIGTAGPALDGAAKGQGRP